MTERLEPTEEGAKIIEGAPPLSDFQAAVFGPAATGTPAVPIQRDDFVAYGDGFEPLR